MKKTFNKVEEVVVEQVVQENETEILVENTQILKPKEETPTTLVQKALKESAKSGKKTTVNFQDGNSLVIQPESSSMIYSTYTSLSETNRKEMDKMLNESLETFSKVIFFTYKNAKETK